MGRRRRSEEIAFVKTLVKIAAFCMKYNAEHLFTELVASIPTAGNQNNKKRTKTWTCSKCKKNFRTKDNRARHEISCKKNEHSRKQIVNKAEARKNKKKSERNIIKAQDKNKKNKQKKPKKKCPLCNKEFVNIDAHYQKRHKINLQEWIKNLRGKPRTSNGTTCLQCNFDYKDVKSFRNHLIKDHNISLLANTRKRCVKDKAAKTRKVVETATAVKKKVSMGNNRAVHEEREIMKDNPDAQEEDETTKPTAQKEKITENKKLQNRRKPELYEVTHEAQKLCKHCNQYVRVSLMKTHTAAHISQRETFLFKPRDSTQNLANTYETVEEIEPSEQGNFMMLTDASNNTTELNRTKDDENHSSSIHSEEEFQTTRDPQDVGTNSGEENVNGSHDVSEDVYIPQNIMRNNAQRQQNQEDERKSRFKLLWNEYYQRMLLADEKDRQELCNKFLNEYASLSRRNAVCHRRLNFDAKRCQRRVDVVSTITSETYVKCQSGVSFTRKIVKNLKTIRYETNDQ